MSYTLDSSSPPYRGANKVLNKEAGELHTGQLLTCIQGANKVLNEELGELSPGQLLICIQGANKVLNKEVGELHTGQLNTCIQGANNALDKELGEIHTGQLLTLNKEVAELLTWPSLPHYEFSTKNTGFLPGGGPRGGRGATANQIKYIIISIHSFTISVRKKSTKTLSVMLFRLSLMIVT